MNLLVFINEATFRESPRFLFRSCFCSHQSSISLSLNLLFFHSFSVPHVMIFIACAIQIQWLRFVVHGFVVSAIAHMQKGHIICFLFRKWFSILLNAHACFVLVFSIRGLGLNKSYHKPRGSYGILMPFCIFLRTMSFCPCKHFPFLSTFISINISNQLRFFV